MQTLSFHVILYHNKFRAWFQLMCDDEICHHIYTLFISPDTLARYYSTKLAACQLNTHQNLIQRLYNILNTFMLLKDLPSEPANL